MKRPFAALLLVVIGFALIASLRLAVPHLFVRASDTAAEQTSTIGESNAAHVPPRIQASEPALPETVDPLLYAGGAQNSGASENTGSIDSAIEAGALLGGSGSRPDASSSGATNPGHANNAAAAGSALFGSNYLWGASGGSNEIDPHGSGNPSGPMSSRAGDRGSILGVDDLQALLPGLGNGTASDFPGGKEIPAVQGETGGMTASVPISEPRMDLLVFLILSLLWFIRSRIARATARAS
jgi:hypothetical protein